MKKPQEAAAVTLDALMAEFWVFDKTFREAVNAGPFSSESLEVRQKIFRIVTTSFMPNPAWTLFYWKGQLSSMEKRSPVRRVILHFLASLASDPRFKNEPQYISSPEERGVYAVLTPDQIALKSQAKRLYNLGNYQAALELMLPLMNIEGPNRNPGIIGFIMNCYHKLGDPEHALEYAERLLQLRLDSPHSSLTALGIATLSAQRLERWEEALRYGEQYLEIKVDIPTVCMTSQAALKLNDPEKAITLAKRYLKEVELEAVVLGSTEGFFRRLARACQECGREADADYFFKLIAESKSISAILQ